MIPCKFCGTFCDDTCFYAKQWLKASTFAKKYGMGPVMSHEQAAFYNYSIDSAGNITQNLTPVAKKKPDGYKVPCTCVEGDDSVACLIHQDDVLKSLTKPNGCPECGNMTWHQGWHYPTCKYHLSEAQCPVPGHKKCAATPPPTPTLQGWDTASGSEIIQNIKDAAMQFKSVGPAAQGLTEIASLAEKAVTEFKGEKNLEEAETYLSGLYLPIKVMEHLAKNDPKALTYSGSCKCAGCKHHTKALLIQKAAKSLLTPVKEDEVSLKAFSQAFDDFVDHPEDADTYVESLSKDELRLITGLKNASKKAMKPKAIGLLSEFLDVDDDDDAEWLAKKFIEIHPNKDTIYKGFTLKGVKFVSSDFSDTELKAATFLAEEKYSTPSQFVMNAPASMTVQANNVSATTINALTGYDVRDLNPGDQVIITVDKAGKLMIPDGMTALVVPK